MSGWDKFQTVGEEGRKDSPGSGGSAWLSWICLVVFLSIAGTALAIFYSRFIGFLIFFPFVWGLSRRGVEGMSRLEVDRYSWIAMFVIAIACAVFGMIGRRITDHFGLLPGSVITFCLINLAVGGGVAWFHFSDRKRERALAAKRGARRASNER